MNALTWLSLAVLVALYYGPVQRLLESIARHHLFVMRDELFDKALKGETSFELDEYKQARKQINSLIRFTHLTTWQNMVLLVKFLRFNKNENAVSPLYRPMRQRAAVLMLGLMILRSPVLLTLSILGLLYQFVGLNVKGLKRRSLSLLNMIERESRSV